MLTPRCASQAGCHDGETLLVQAPSAPPRSSICPPLAAIESFGHQQHIAAAEELDLRPRRAAAPSESNCRGQIANREIDITAAGGTAQCRRRLGRVARQHGMAERAQAQPRNPEGDADAGAEQGAQDRRLAAPGAILPAARRPPRNTASGSAIDPPVESRSHRRERQIHIVQGFGVADKHVSARQQGDGTSLRRMLSCVGRSK